MEFKIFSEILSAAKRIDKVVEGLESTLGVQFGDGVLLDIQTDLLTLLTDKYELDIDEESVIYRYAFENRWGEVPEIYYINGDEYTVNSVESLYEYLVAKTKHRHAL